MTKRSSTWQYRPRQGLRPARGAAPAGQAHPGRRWCGDLSSAGPIASTFATGCTTRGAPLPSAPRVPARPPEGKARPTHRLSIPLVVSGPLPEIGDRGCPGCHPSADRSVVDRHGARGRLRHAEGCSGRVRRCGQVDVRPQAEPANRHPGRPPRSPPLEAGLGRDAARGVATPARRPARWRHLDRRRELRRNLRRPFRPSRHRHRVGPPQIAVPHQGPTTDAPPSRPRRPSCRMP